MPRLKSTVLWKSILLTGLCGLGLFSLWWWGVVHVVETHGRSRAEESLVQIRQTVDREFKRAEDTGHAFGAWWSSTQGRLDEPENLQSVIPFLEKGAIITNLVLSCENGDSACVVRRDGEWNLILFKDGRSPRRYMVRNGHWVLGPGDEREVYVAKDRYWYQFGAAHSAPAWTPEAYRYFSSAVAGFTYTVPIRSGDGRLLGVIGVDVSLEELTQLIWEQRPTPDSRTIVTDSEGRLLVPPRLKGMLDPPTRFAHHLMPLSPSLMETLLSGQMSVRPGETPYLLDLGKTYVGATGLFSPKSRPQMNLHVAIPEDDLFPGQRRFALLTFLVALLVVLGVAWSLFDLHNRVIRPMRQLAEEDASPSADPLEPMNFNSDIWELQRVGEKLHLAGRADSERKRLMTQVEHSQRVDAVGHMAPGIVHDVNNQLSLVLGQIGICRTILGVHPELEPHLRAAEGATLKCSEVLRALMDYSRPNHGQRELLSLNDLVEHAAALLRRVMGGRIRVETDLSQDLPLLFGEPIKLQQILVNLGLNARDAMPEGGVLRLRTFRLEEKACLLVEDTGSGMTAEVRERVFEPFFTTKAPEKGTGLGLAMVANIVSAHGGKIHLETEPGAGTRFQIEFPPTLRKQDGRRGDS
ncbi:hypothetical protein GETHLI_06540 [Geothrix limicola]|uniref:histidine kinase n=1 Tax=Geothrix limicola TaxID=2927978 RepID=A0ABQ5QBY2_9BACT|nr:PAS domain-containing sensor histidine kinase [Geothrix limicola]GLH72152.1 hypothetical protein GETHLI_06540 [Geothrix limicola]